MTDFKQGDRVMIVGERGTYVVKTATPYNDGSLLLFGGSTNPNARQRFRNVLPNKLKLDTRKHHHKDDAAV